MDPIDVIFADGGPFMTVVVVAAVVAVLVQVLWTVLTALGRRFAAPVWLAAPLTVATLGIVGTLVRCLGVLEEIEAGTSGEPLVVLSGEGYAFSLYNDVVGMMAAGFVLGLSLLLGGIAAYVSADHDSERDLRAALPPFIVGGAVGLGLLIWGLVTGLGLPLVGVAIVVLLTGAGCGLGALRKPQGEEAEDVAAAVRAFLGLLGVAAALALMVSCLTRGESLEYRAMAIGKPENRDLLMALGEQITLVGLIQGLIATAAALACLVVPVVPLLEHLKRRATVIGGVVGLVLVLAVVGFRVGVATRTCELQEIADEAEPLVFPGEEEAG